MDIIKPVFPVIVPYIAAGMVRSVMYGMSWAMQEFACNPPPTYPSLVSAATPACFTSARADMAAIEAVSTSVYIPLCLYAKCKRRPSPLPTGAASS